MELLNKIIPEKGIVDIISNYTYHAEHSDKYISVMDELSMEYVYNIKTNHGETYGELIREVNDSVVSITWIHVAINNNTTGLLKDLNNLTFVKNYFTGTRLNSAKNKTTFISENTRNNKIIFCAHTYNQN